MSTADASLQLMLRALKRPSFVANHEAIGREVEQHGWTFG